MSEVPGSTTPNTWPEPQSVKTKQYPCPDCDRVFDKPQGLGAHRSRAHGYRTANGKSTKATPVTPTAIEALVESILPKGIPTNRVVLEAVLNLMSAYDHLVELANHDR